MEVCRPPPSPTATPLPARASCPPRRSADLARTDLGVYVHVPFCTVRCGYCDFNTYTLTELGGPGASIGIDTYADAALRELDIARSVLGDEAPSVSTVFVGGGTPTMLRSGDLVAVLDGIRERFGLAPDAEVTTEANPDSVTPESLRELADGGFTRVSVGMQSAVPHVLAHPRPHPRPRQRRARRRGHPGGRHAGQRRPHLRHAGGVARRLAAQPRGGRRARARPRLGLRPRRRGGHQARRAGAPRRRARTGGRRRGRQVRARRRAARRRPASGGTR